MNLRYLLFFGKCNWDLCMGYNKFYGSRT